MQFDTIPTDKLIGDGRNVRRDLGDLTELAASIKSQGMLEPLVVAPVLDGWRIIAGHRRAAAATQAGLAEVPAIIRDDLESTPEIVGAMLVENLQRQNLSAVEEGEAYEQLALHDVDTAEMAKLTGRNRKTITSRRSLMKLAEPEQDRVHAGELTLDQAAALVEFADDPDTYKTLARDAGGFNFDWTLKNARNRRDAAAEVAKLRAELESAGATIHDEADQDDDDEGPIDHDTMTSAYSLVTEDGDDADPRSLPIEDVVWVQNKSGRHLEAWVRNPAEHGLRHRWGHLETPEERAERQAEHEAKLKHREALEAAHEVRMDVVARIGAAKKPPKGYERLLLLAMNASSVYYGRTIEVDVNLDATGPAALGQALVLACRRAEFALGAAWHSPRVWLDDLVTAYVDLLKAAGWEPSQVERDGMDQAEVDLAESQT
ncbi:ParB/RepB/Spo0J family partition protein [Haloactinopolyspora alba]|uniref:ParB/RepB/Spo0J family partition protein n=1 Tax=Haloactinopolyspora alba TaxID=648780 RepID=A0A2P8DEV0_9ACTN|nr:ParB/RepB/Spo0J family partition protein [Haloactinopolyspora alba]PSK95753.1 ParB/RepB/Spo0J family partition protein [Haloactinopolyspora alba]